MTINENTRFGIGIGTAVFLACSLVTATIQLFEIKQVISGDHRQLKYLRNWAYVGAFPETDFSKDYKKNHRWEEIYSDD
jgi:hypothetical protein